MSRPPAAALGYVIVTPGGGAFKCRHGVRACTSADPEGSEAVRNADNMYKGVSSTSLPTYMNHTSMFAVRLSPHVKMVCTLLTP